MQIFIKKPRKDNKAVVSYRFDNGRIINKLTKLDDIPKLLVSNSKAEFLGNTYLLNDTPILNELINNCTFDK